MFTEMLGLYYCDCWAESFKCYPCLAFVKKLSVCSVCRSGSVGSPLHQHHNDPIPTSAHSSVGKTLMGWEIYVWMFPKDEVQCWPGRSWGWLVNIIPLKLLSQLVRGGTDLWNDNTFTSGHLPRRLPSDSNRFHHPVEYILFILQVCIKII